MLAGLPPQSAATVEQIEAFSSDSPVSLRQEFPDFWAGHFTRNALHDQVVTNGRCRFASNDPRPGIREYRVGFHRFI